MLRWRRGGGKWQEKMKTVNADCLLRWRRPAILLGSSSATYLGGGAWERVKALNMVRRSARRSTPRYSSDPQVLLGGSNSEGKVMERVVACGTGPHEFNYSHVIRTQPQAFKESKGKVSFALRTPNRPMACALSIWFRSI
jgi:hypothetical protein